ncbi:hypothetical protein ACFORG_04840 [Lutimaribacter marinistellae]|uniref:Uncharacterized protein n=1 Tax=Lutimaribacter marinistellae TaxID=1820329 RepID=A0ABV7TC17_9RHOB
MPLELLLLLVIGGIAAIAALLHLSGRSARRHLLVDDIETEWLRHFPDDIVIDHTLSRDGHAALVRTEAGPGLLWAFGADTVAQRLRDYDLTDHKRGYRVDFHDFATPHVILHLDDFERPRWRNLLERS